MLPTSQRQWKKIIEILITVFALFAWFQLREMQFSLKRKTSKEQFNRRTIKCSGTLRNWIKCLCSPERLRENWSSFIEFHSWKVKRFVLINIYFWRFHHERVSKAILIDFVFLISDRLSICLLIKGFYRS